MEVHVHEPTEASSKSGLVSDEDVTLQSDDLGPDTPEALQRRQGLPNFPAKLPDCPATGKMDSDPRARHSACTSVP